MIFGDILDLLQRIWLSLVDFINVILDFLSFEVGFGDFRFSIWLILFGVGFTSFVIFKAITSA